MHVCKSTSIDCSMEDHGLHMTHKASAGLVYLRADGVVSRSNRSRDAEYKAIEREQADDDPVCFAGLNYRRCMRSCNRCSQVCLHVRSDQPTWPSTSNDSFILAGLNQFSICPQSDHTKKSTSRCSICHRSICTCVRARRHRYRHHRHESQR